MMLTAARLEAEATTTSVEKLCAVATIAPLADWVKNVGGNEVEVVTLVPPGTSPHTFEPSPSDLRLIARSRLFVAVGLGLDDWSTRLARSNKGIRLLQLGNRLKEQGVLPQDLPTPETLNVEDGDHHEGNEVHEHGHTHTHSHGGTDPHFWLDPLLAKQAVTEIENVLTEIAPDRAATWQRGAKVYCEQLAALDREIQQMLAGCKGQRLVSSHNAFAYFAKRYGLVVAGVVEEYPGKQPSERDIKKLVQRLRAKGIKTIFAEPQMDTRLARIIAGEVGGTVGILDPEGTAQRQSYLELMRYNAQQVKAALCP